MAWLKLLATRVPFLLMVWLVDRAGGDADALVGHSARGFPDAKLFDCLRHQPCAALEHLLAWRLSHFDEQRIAERTRRGQQQAMAIDSADAYVAGIDNPSHTFWVFPLVCTNPELMVRELRAAGLDASQISGLTVVGDDSPDHWFRHTLFVPWGEQVPEGKLDEVARILRQHS